MREWKLEDFAAAIAFVNRVADAAEAANHHPDILMHGWNKVRLELSTHSEGGLTQADFEMAARIDDSGLSGPEPCPKSTSAPATVVRVGHR